MILDSMIQDSMTEEFMLDPFRWPSVKARLDQIELLIGNINDRSEQSLAIDMVVRLRVMLIDIRCQYPRYTADEVRDFYDAMLLILRAFGARD